VIQGTGGKDRIEVSERNGLVTVRLNDVARTYCQVSSLLVEGLGGDDTVSLRGLTVRTTVDGGDGNDWIDASAVTGRGVVLYGGAGNDHLTGGAGDDRMDGGTGDDQLWGGCGNDLLVGGQGKDCLYGGDGNDLLDGGADNDQLRGGDGNDLLIADGGDDYLKGEDGNDILVGGAGNDSSQGNYGADLLVDGPGCDSTGWVSCQDKVVDGSKYGIPTTLPAQPSEPVIDWSYRYEALVDSLQEFCDHPSNPQWWEDFVTNLGESDVQVNPNSQIRVVVPGTDV
jgi:Ca2+-binding RTX toxin-like protein